MPITDTLVSNSTQYAEAYPKGRPLPPKLNVAVVACMDARLDPFGLLGLEVGDAHVIRNAGGAVTEDSLRSLAISQHLLGTTEIILIHHTDCGMLTFTDDELRGSLAEATGQRPTWSPESFTDLDTDVRHSIARVRSNPFLIHRDSVRGFVFDVHTGELREVS